LPHFIVLHLRIVAGKRRKVRKNSKRKGRSKKNKKKSGRGRNKGRKQKERRGQEKNKERKKERKRNTLIKRTKQLYNTMCNYCMEVL
jgi:hypothetical protein